MKTKGKGLKGAKAKTKALPGQDAKLSTGPNAAKGKSGRKRITDSKSQVELQGDVEELLANLRVTASPLEKRRIRRALRCRGHKGGLGGKTELAPLND